MRRQISTCWPLGTHAIKMGRDSFLLRDKKGALHYNDWRQIYSLLQIVPKKDHVLDMNPRVFPGPYLVLVLPAG